MRLGIQDASDVSFETRKFYPAGRNVTESELQTFRSADDDARCPVSSGGGGQSIHTAFRKKYATGPLQTVSDRVKPTRTRRCIPGGSGARQLGGPDLRAP